MRTALTAALLLAGSVAGAAQPVAISTGQRAALGIESAALETVAMNRSSDYPARVAVPNAQLEVVTSPQRGLVEVLLVAEGEAVKKGQPLARIQSPGLLDLQGEYLETHTRFTLAESNYRRDRQLHEEGIIAARRLAETRARHQELSTSLARLRRALQLAGMDDEALQRLDAQRELSSTLFVSAPFDGVVLEQIATAGNRVDAADPLYRIASLDPLWLEIHVPLEQLGDTAPGQTVLVPELGLSGRIVTVGRMVHGLDQGVLIRAEVSEGSEQLHPGQFVQAQIATAADTPHFRVPRSAVVTRDAQTWVFVEQAQGFTPVPVTVASEQADHLVVRGELPAGSRIATAGAAALKAAWLGGAE